MRIRSLAPAMALCLALAACDSAEEKAQAHYERGMELLQNGDQERARVEFQNALRELGTFVEPRLELARLSYAEGADGMAFREYLRVSEQVPDNLEARRRLAELAFLNRDWETFDTQAQAAIEISTEDPDVQMLDLVRRYRQAVEAEDSAARRTLLEEAEALNSGAEMIRLILIDGYSAFQRFEDALLQIEALIAENPEDLSLYNNKLQVLGQLGREDDIGRELLNMTETFPENPDIRSSYLRFLIARGELDTAEAFLRDRVSDAPDTDQPVVDLVRFQLDMRDVETAQAELDHQIETRPESFVLRTLRASLLFDQGDRDVAIAEMQEIVDALDTVTQSSEAEIDPDTLTQQQEVKVTLATMLAANGNDVGARRLVEGILADDPNVVGALKMQARWMIADDDTDGAINAMRTALASAAQDTEAMTIMAQAYQRAGNRTLMMDFLSLAVEASNNAPEESLRLASALREEDKLPQAEAVLISALRIQPSNRDIIIALGEIYADMEDVGRLRQVVETLRNDPERNALVISSFEVRLLEIEGGPEEALAYLDQIVEEDAENPNLKMALIQGYLQNDNVDAAVGLIDEAIEAEPDNPAFRYLRSITLSAQGDLDGAITELEGLVDAYPATINAWLRLIRLQTILGEPGGAQQTLDNALAANSDHPSLLWAKASLLERDNDFEGAIAVYEDLYARNSSNVIFANNLASLLTAFRRDEESLEKARLIARRLKDTEIPAFQDTYGWIQHRSGNSEDAIAYLEPAAAALVDDPTVQYHLGAAYEGVGRREEALAQMQKAIAIIGPLGSTDLAGEIRENIARLRAEMEKTE